MAQLRQADVLAGAFNLLDAEGLDALTMRKLATSLHVQAGALYWHFDGKRALIGAMAERLIADVGAPRTASGGTWDEQLTELVVQLRKALLAHRDGARLVMEVAYASGGASTARLQHMSTDLLIRAGFAPEQAYWLSYALRHYVVGQTMGEQARADLAARGELGAARAVTSDGQDEDEASRLARTSTLNSDPDEQFAYALSVFIDGIKHRLP